jgi:hypothetical protein
VQEFYHAMCLITFIIHVKHSNVLIDNTYFSIRMVVAFEEQSIGGEILAYSLRPAKSVHFDFFQSNHFMID